MNGKQRYGFDVLNLVLLIIGLVASFLFKPYGFIVSALTIGWAFFRALSTNLSARASEMRWLKNKIRGLKSSLTTLWYRLKVRVQTLKEKIRYKRQYKVFKCKNCGQKLRVPRGKGRIRVTCRNCGSQFSMKS